MQKYDRSHLWETEVRRWRHVAKVVPRGDKNDQNVRNQAMTKQGIRTAKPRTFCAANEFCLQSCFVT